MARKEDSIKSLLNQYSVPEAISILRTLSPLLIDEGKAFLSYLESEASRPSSRLSTSTWSSNHSVTSFTLDRPSSGMSGASSIAESTHSNFISESGHVSRLSNQLTIAPGQPPQRKGNNRSASAHRVSKQHKPSTPSPLLSPKAASLECPFCSEVKIPSSIARKADLKRHFKQFHQNNVQWICPERGCYMGFDWKNAFDVHLKKAHRKSQHASEDVIVKLCPQVVFACGFSNCRLVFEANDEDDAEKTAQNYFNHVVKHFDDNLMDLSWEYSVRFRNLMRQRAVDIHWKDRKKGGPQELIWQPHNSSVLRKMLEARHFPDIPLLVQWAVYLGSMPFCEPHSPVPRFPANISLPRRDQCTLVTSSHGPAHDRPADSQRHPPMDAPVVPQPTSILVSQHRENIPTNENFNEPQQTVTDPTEYFDGVVTEGLTAGLMSPQAFDFSSTPFSVPHHHHHHHHHQQNGGLLPQLSHHDQTTAIFGTNNGGGAPSIIYTHMGPATTQQQLEDSTSPMDMTALQSPHLRQSVFGYDHHNGGAASSSAATGYRPVTPAHHHILTQQTQQAQEEGYHNHTSMMSPETLPTIDSISMDIDN
ncbi:hypothetical protein B0H66DRAFT_602854 [Apodospora peruviana]|uniref:C2H2-type domain-containing protein n=1 Tax=Apodospora peruviana TaxID=516989 RepID=A0AAE0M555_9PEZI|nr:hypothetical protein B0H66DRAFT_602854 [Apodospora peruviana]